MLRPLQPAYRWRRVGQQVPNCEARDSVVKNLVNCGVQQILLLSEEHRKPSVHVRPELKAPSFPLLSGRAEVVLFAQDSSALAKMATLPTCLYAASKNKTLLGLPSF